MNTLNFIQKEGLWVAETVVNNDYSLHIERKRSGRFYISQCSTESGMYASCNLPYWLANTGKIIDYSFGHGAYPKYIRIVSESEVVVGKIIEAE